MFLSGVFGGMCGDNSCNVFLLLFMVLWVPIFVTLCRRAVLMLWHAFLFLGLRFFPSFLLLAWGSPLLFLVRIYPNNSAIGDSLDYKQIQWHLLFPCSWYNQYRIILPFPFLHRRYFHQVLMLWHDFPFLGLRFFPLFYTSPCLLVVSAAFPCNNDESIFSRWYD
jgi:hypothetical protein